MSKKEVISTTAIGLFVELGFHGTTTSKIAEQSGVANGTLFNYFSSKEELIVTLYHGILLEKDDFMAEAVGSHSIAKESFQAHFFALLFWSLDNRVQHQYVQQFIHSPYFKKGIELILNEQQSLFMLIQNGIDVVLLKPLAADLIYSLFNSQINGLYNYIISTEKTKEEQLQIAQDSFEVLWKTIED